MVIPYGLALAVIAFGLTWLDYRVQMRDIGMEVYSLIIAILFLGLGLWMGLQRSPLTIGSADAPEDAILETLGLTKREIEMLSFLAQGKSNKEIARALALSPNTVKTHLANLYRKLGVPNRTGAVMKAVELSAHPFA